MKLQNRKDRLERQNVRGQRFAHADVLSLLGETICMDLGALVAELGRVREPVRVKCAEAAAEMEEEGERWDGLG